MQLTTFRAGKLGGGKGFSLHVIKLFKNSEKGVSKSFHFEKEMVSVGCVNSRPLVQKKVSNLFNKTRSYSL